LEVGVPKVIPKRRSMMMSQCHFYSNTVEINTQKGEVKNEKYTSWEISKCEQRKRE
jgi:hypothetical protein